MTATRLRSPLPTAALTGLTGLGLFRFAPAMDQLRAGLIHPHAWIEQVGLDAALASFAGALLWVAALWLMLGLLAALLSQLPGRLGSTAGAFARRVLPAALRGAVLASTGASLLINPVAAMAASPVASGQPTVTASTPFWPLDDPDHPLPAPGWPTASGSEQAPAPTSPTAAGGTPARPRPSSGTPGSTAIAKTPPSATPVITKPPAPARPPANTSPGSADSITVQPGDSLWTIAAHRIGTAAQANRIAIEWPYWYRANRKVIGSDPGLLQPGTELVVPDHAMDSPR